MMRTEDKTRMTEGSISRKIILFAIPLFLGNLFQQLYNTADSLIVGNYLGSNALAAVSSSGNLIFLMVGFINGIAMGAGVVIARYYGAKDRANLEKSIHTTVAFGIAAGIALTVIGMLLAPKILVLMGTPAEVLPESITYFRTYFAGSIGVIMYNIFVGILQSVGDSRHPLIYLIISSCINVVLDIFFIVRLHMGVDGCAWATVISQGISALLCLIYMIRRFELLKLSKEDFRKDFPVMGRLLAIGIPMGLQFSITAIGTIIVQGAVNIFGAVYIAGFSAAGKIQNLVASVFVSFGATIATYVGQNRGAGNMERIRQGVRSTQIMILIWSVVMFTFIQIAGGPMIHIFVDPAQTEVVQAAKDYFTAVAWCYPFLGSIFLYRNALQGLGYGLVPMMGYLNWWPELW